MKTRIIIHSLDQLPQKCIDFFTVIQENKLKKIAFSGEMGVGKTTFIGTLMTSMGIEQEASSPTYSIVDEHFSPKHGKINHFDFYRIENEEEVYDLGIEEYLADDSYCFMEWPEKVKKALSNQCLWVNLSESDGIRTLEFDL